MPRTSVAIRPVTPADEPAWRALWTDYLRFYEAAVPEDVYAHTFARVTAGEYPGPFGLLAERDGQVLGLVHYLFHGHAWRIEDVCYLQDLYTVPEARGTGVGRALIEAVYRAADAAGAPAVYWLTQEFNYAGRMLYDRVGVKSPFIRYNRPL